ncbi:MAG: DUF4834 family protein [bacterium]|nr:DUF4834 family protein [bacterium]
MIKFLFYLFLFYVVYRYVFGGFKVKVFHYHKNEPQRPKNAQNYQEEGTVTIDPKVTQQAKKPKSDQLGEYVDYEEVK